MIQEETIMKRFLAIMLCLLLALGLCACGGDTPAEPTELSATDPVETEPAKPALPENPKTLKVLTLGHSGTVDSNHMLALVANAEGYTGLTVATLYHSGCRLAQHVQFLTEDSPEYNLYLSNSANPAPPEVLMNVTMKQALRYDNWDVIIIQGQGFEMGKEENMKMGYIQIIQDYVNEHKLNPNAVFGWHTGWCSATEPELMDMYPYTPNTYYTNYAPYNTDRNNLYNVLIERIKTYILPDESFAVIIHTGTAFENALSSYMTEFDLHRDYTHGTDYTRLMAAYVWYCKLLGIEQLEDIKQDVIPVKYFRSNTGLQDIQLTELEKNILIESVNNTLKNPYEITQSQYTEAPQ